MRQVSQHRSIKFSQQNHSVFCKSRFVMKLLCTCDKNFPVLWFRLSSLIVVVGNNRGFGENSSNLWMKVFLDQTIIQDAPNKEHPLAFFFQTLEFTPTSPLPTYITLRHGRERCLFLNGVLSHRPKILFYWFLLIPACYTYCLWKQNVAPERFAWQRWNNVSSLPISVTIC